MIPAAAHAVIAKLNPALNPDWMQLHLAGSCATANL